jgi:hypothetical protein
MRFRKKRIVSRHAKIPMLIGTLSGLLLNRHAQAQSVLPPSPESATTPAALQSAQNDEMDVFATPVAETESEPFRWGLLTLRPHPYYQFLYGSGILVNPGQPVNTTIQQISPGFLIDVGSRLTLNYTPTLTLYSNKNFKNTFDNAVGLMWGGAYNNWVFGASQSYTAVSAPTVQTGTQTSQENYLTTASASYNFNTKMSVDLAVNQNFNFVGNSLSSTNSTVNLESFREWSTLDWLNYQFWPRLNVAAGIGLGYDDVASSPDMLFEQYQARIQWRTTDKISFQLHGGVEDLQFLSGGQSDLISPVFDGTIQYQPFEVTKLSLIAQRSVSPSFFQNQATENTSFSGNLNQRLLQFFYLDLNGGYQITKYTSSTSSAPVNPNREDDYYFLNTQLSCTFLKRGTVAVFYQLGDNSSSNSGFGFVTHQIGFQIGYSY